jgi:hypothetical protein
VTGRLVWRHVPILVIQEQHRLISPAPSSTRLLEVVVDWLTHGIFRGYESYRGEPKSWCGHAGVNASDVESGTVCSERVGNREAYSALTKALTEDVNGILHSWLSGRKRRTPGKSYDCKCRDDPFVKEWLTGLDQRKMVGGEGLEPPTSCL